MNKKRSFPLIRELPELIKSSDLVWKKPSPHEEEIGIKAEWWIGTDLEKKRWLVKMTNGFCAYREHVFASLAQRIGISCQSSAYLLIDSKLEEPRLHQQNIEPYQLAIWLMDEHAGILCSNACPWSDYWESSRGADYLEIKQASVSISCFEDLVRADILGYLCGQFEPHDHFLTSRHEYVVIDNELMFSDTSGLNPSLNGCRWLEFDDALPLVSDVCRRIAQITNEELHEIADIPVGYTILNGRNLCPDLHKAKAAAIEYLS